MSGESAEQAKTDAATVLRIESALARQSLSGLTAAIRTRSTTR